jgi:phenylacetate-coenzyme A ligase PaaK-like adenylate-forming protein
MLQATVEGRADDVLRFGGVDVHPLVLRSVMVRAPEVAEYQVRQTATGVEADVVAQAGLDEDALASALSRALDRAGVPGATASVRRVGAIPRHPHSGKARRFIPLCA